MYTYMYVFEAILDIVFLWEVSLDTLQNHKSLFGPMGKGIESGAFEASISRCILLKSIGYK